MNQNSLEGFQKGHFKRLDGLYLEKVSSENSMNHGLWCNAICDAMTFDSEDEARVFLRDIFGFDFANENMVVISAHEKALKSSKQHPNYYKIQAHSYLR